MVTLYREHLDSPIGELVCICNNTSIIRLLWASDNEEEEIQKIADWIGESVTLKFGNTVTETVCQELRAYFCGKRKTFSVLPTFVCGSLFAQNVWQEISRIPFGQVLSYQQLAVKCGVSGARAVGNAVGKNPVPILVPCHRIIRKSGELGGFGGGTEIKRKLLRVEGVLFDEGKSQRIIKFGSDPIGFR